MKKGRKNGVSEYDGLREELRIVNTAIEDVNANFSYVTDPDMIDCCIYELKALQIRHKIIMSRMRSEELKACICIKEEASPDDI